MDNDTTQVNTDISPAEVSTRKKLIIFALILSVPIAIGVVVMVLANVALSIGVMWLITGLILLPLITYKWNWFKKYTWRARGNVKGYGERSYRLILPVFYTVLGIVFTVLGVLSP